MQVISLGSPLKSCIASKVSYGALSLTCTVQDVKGLYLTGAALPVGLVIVSYTTFVLLFYYFLYFYLLFYTIIDMNKVKQICAFFQNFTIWMSGILIILLTF